LPLQSTDRREQLECLISEGDRKHSEKMVQAIRRPVISSQKPSHSLVCGNLGRTRQKKNSLFKQSLSYDTASSRKLNRTRGHNGNWKKSTYSKLQKSRFSHAWSSSRYLHCERCGSFVLRSAVWLHRRRCIWAHQKTKIGERSSGVSSSSPNEFISYDNILKNKGMDSNVDDVLSLALGKDNDSSLSVQTKDMLIRRYASLRMQSLGNQDSESSDNIFYNICQELQALARLVVECQRQKPSTELHTLIHPDHFNLFNSVLRKQSATVVDILGHVINIKIVDALQHSDNLAARHAWNFRELFLMWQDSLREDHSVMQTDANANVQEERQSSAATRCQSQQPDVMEFGVAIKNPAYRILQTEYSGCLDVTAHA